MVFALLLNLKVELVLALILFLKKLYGGPTGDRTPTRGLQSHCAPIITISPYRNTLLNSPSTLVAISPTRGRICKCARIWCPRSDSNRHASRHWLLRPAWLPLHHRGKNLVAYGWNRTNYLQLMRLTRYHFSTPQ